MGVLLPDNQVVMQPGFLVDHPAGAAAPADTPAYAEVRGDDGRPLVRHPLELVPLQAQGGESAHAVAGSVPFPAGAKSIHLFHREIEVHTVLVAAHAPDV